MCRCLVVVLSYVSLYGYSTVWLCHYFLVVVLRGCIGVCVVVPSG